MTPQPFKVGDRVAVYGPAWAAHHEGRMVSHKATVTKVIDEDTLEIRPKDGLEYFVHPKQCRRLKRKERRRVFITRTDLSRMYEANRGVEARISPVGIFSHDVEFIEVPRKTGKDGGV